MAYTSARPIFPAEKCSRIPRPVLALGLPHHSRGALLTRCALVVSGAGSRVPREGLPLKSGAIQRILEQGRGSSGQGIQVFEKSTIRGLKEKVVISEAGDSYRCGWCKNDAADTQPENSRTNLKLIGSDLGEMLQGC
jgi:hypothetical protein